ncbi:MAG: GNAT family N-acetyltransferase [Bacteroidales bacterium]|nr:MAG: GNAT family N-acetyltransferase [Bacteroidales bacterium]
MAVFVNPEIMNNNNKYKFELVNDDEGFLKAKKLFMEYADAIQVDLCFQDFENELKEIDIQYSKPSGGIFIIIDNETGESVGCVGIRRFKNNIAELKRMYVKDSHRNKGLGKKLLDKAIKLAKELRYEKVQLDTLDSMKTAIALYKSNGFTEIEAYRYNPVKGVKYFELKL